MKPEITNCLTWYANQIEMACEYYHEPNDIYEKKLRSQESGFWKRSKMRLILII